jgi:NAD(P)-dependent dehydrogenase (short-subunit alcohol dehydrogenase family)
MNLENRTAVVTGSASGIGRAIAVSLARRGCSLALADVNDQGLSETARMAQLAQADGLPLRECVTAHYRVVVSFATHYREALQLRFSHYNVSATIEIFAAPRAPHHSGGKISCAAETLPGDGLQRLGWSTTARA